MNGKLYSYVFLFNIISIEISCYDKLNDFVGGRKYRDNSYSKGSKSLDCEQDCVCMKQIDENILHCDTELHASLRFSDKSFGLMQITCDVTLESQNLTHDYYSIMEIKDVEEVNLFVVNCPEPPGSYASLLAAPLPQDKKGTRISELKIDCGLRNNFTLLKEHFDGLSKLIFLEISCGVLVDLPGDLFLEKFPNLIKLNISNTLIKEIPDGLFSDFHVLERIIIQWNKIEKIGDNDFRGLDMLKHLHIEENNLISFEENAFDHITTLSSLVLIKTKINRLPSSVGKLVALESIKLLKNHIVSIEGICDAFLHLAEVKIVDNLINYMDPSCFSSFGRANSIDISGNSFSILPETPILMNELTTFELSHNTEAIVRTPRFIVSNALEDITMEESNIESIDQDFLHGLPSLSYIRLTKNKISHLHEDFFIFNTDLENIFLDGNQITAIPEGLFRNNIYIKTLDISANQIYHLPSSLFSKWNYLISLDIQNNYLESIPEALLINLNNIQRINLSNNRIRFLDNNTFVGLYSLQTLDISRNFLDSSVSNSFWPFKEYKHFNSLYLNGNSISYIPPMDELTLRFLNLANNNLSQVEKDTFVKLQRLRRLDLSMNRLETLPNSTLVKGFELEILQLSFNQLREFPQEFLPKRNQLYLLDLSGNEMERFDICSLHSAGKLEELHLSENKLYEISDLSSCYLELESVKLLNLSHNQISFNDSLWAFDWIRKTWGRISPLLIFPNLEEIYMVNNSISTIFMDWRNMFPRLRKIDLRYNKINHLTHQDLLFTSTMIMENGTYIPYECYHSLLLDLRFNQIKKLELPTPMLIQTTRQHKIKLYGHVTINMDDNPFYCGCGIINFLRLLDDDVALTSELRRTEGKEWILSANIHVGNLSCWQPEIVHGKKLAESETWLHHILPTLDSCPMLVDENRPANSMQDSSLEVLQKETE